MDEQGNVIGSATISRDITDRQLVENLLMNERERIKAILNKLADPVFLKDNDHRIILANPAFYSMFGLEENSVIGQTLAEHVPENERKQFLAVDRQVLDTGITDQREETLTLRGFTRTILTTKTSFVDNLGERYLVGTIHDITDRKNAEHEILIAATAFESHEGMTITDVDGTILKVNASFSRITGYSSEEVVGKNTRILKSGRQNSDFYVLMWERIKRTGSWEGEIWNCRKTGEIYPAFLTITAVKDINGNVTNYVGAQIDITERKQSERLLAESEEQYRLLITTMAEGVTLQDENSVIIAHNKSAERILGLTADQLNGRTSLDPRWYAVHEDGSPFPGETHPVVMTLKTGLPQSDVIMGIHKPDGELTWISVNVQPIFNEGKTTPYRVVATMHDITERRKAAEQIERLAHFDQLTGLPNRTLLDDHFKYAISMAQRSNEPLAVMFLDLDHFKDINDTLGHSIGDQVLMQTAKRLKDCLREEDILSRQGGDEFILVLPTSDADGAALVASKLIGVVSQPCLVEQHELIVTPSIGIAIYPNDGTTLELLSKNADIAMYRAKREGRNNYRFYTPEMQTVSARNLNLANALRHALERGELMLHYQPQLSIQDGHIIGVEALLRWQHPELGMVSPAEFIPIAESSGQIIAIGEWVLRTATRQLKRWIESGLTPMVMAVNLSAVQFRQHNLPELITRILDEINLPHQYLELELTEAAAMDHPLAAIVVMDRLHELGIRMSIDDFGTGYSSLSYLKKFKVYKLKIDQSFVRDLTDDPEDKAIVTAIINMASSLGLQTIAEGVETASQLAFLRMQGCNEVQGYYFSKPLPAAQLEEFVRETKIKLSTL